MDGFDKLYSEVGYKVTFTTPDFKLDLKDTIKLSDTPEVASVAKIRIKKAQSTAYTGGGYAGKGADKFTPTDLPAAPKIGTSDAATVFIQFKLAPNQKPEHPIQISRADFNPKECGDKAVFSLTEANTVTFWLTGKLSSILEHLSLPTGNLAWLWNRNKEVYIDITVGYSTTAVPASAPTTTTPPVTTSPPARTATPAGTS